LVVTDAEYQRVLARLGKWRQDAQTVAEVTRGSYAGVFVWEGRYINCQRVAAVEIEIEQNPGAALKEA